MKVSRNPNFLGDDWAVMKCNVSIDEDDFLELDNGEEKGKAARLSVGLKRWTITTVKYPITNLKLI
ncbi:hypothetical protein [Paenibacillus sp. GYB003]|uniref:hypothetical protein n=1 Tax=Paenibacillus sp. GYB003 TaxID=2994392 RepID=UPI002F963EDA